MAEDAGLAEAGSIFCAHCGYSLRGLAGDPIRCPECGGHTPVELGEAVGPEIERQLLQLETAPAMSVAGIVFFAMFSLAHLWAQRRLAQAFPHYVLAGLQVVSIVLLVAGHRLFSARCRTAAGWRAYWRYLLIGCGGSAVIAGAVFAAPVILPASGDMAIATAIGLGLLTLAVGPALHRWAREPLDGAQRALAVMLAERQIRKDEASRAREP